MNCSEVIVSYLKGAGIDHIFGYPGDPSVEFLEAARKEQMKFVLATREGTAGLMAEAYGQLTGRPGVCLSTLGPGSSNLVNAVANAFLDRVPMIALSGQIETKREKLFTHQVLDHNLLFSPISKWTASIAPHTVGGIMRRALRIAVSERPGPVHISTPADVVGAQATDSEILIPPLDEHAAAISVITQIGRTDPFKKIASAKRPVIVTGISAQRADAGKAIASLSEKLRCPIIVSPMAKGVVTETAESFAGVLDMACNEVVWEFLRKADLILSIGFDPVELIKPWNVPAPVIHIDSTPNTDQIYFSPIEIVGPVRQSVQAIVEQIAESESIWRTSEISEHRKHLRDRYLEGRVAGKLNPTDVVESVMAASSDNAIATSDVGSHKLLVGQGWVARHPRSVLMTNGLSSMGYSLPAAITAKLVHRDREVVCFTGDGGLAMVQGELRLAATLKLGITVIVFCDNSLNRIELKQMAKQYPSFGTLIESTDVASLAGSMGCRGVNVSSQWELEKMLALRSPTDDVPLVIGAKIDPAQYLAQF
ncbi:hypothetical protein UP09_05375 [Bradyrhizobium sp. LTSP885]|nr:hypothetical protein UP09_05375 [Bradyrhizobium sp. LTSP885]